MVDTSWPLVYTNYCIIIIKLNASFMLYEIESEFVS